MNLKNFTTGDDQVSVEVYYKKDKHERSHFDIFRLKITSFDEKNGATEDKIIDMTPDEALSIANTLNTATMFWLMNYKNYHDDFMKTKKVFEKKYKKIIKQK